MPPPLTHLQVQSARVESSRVDNPGGPAVNASLVCGGARLLHGNPREILARIVPGDPLALRALIAERLAERRLIADADRLQLQLAIRIARRAAFEGARGELRAWLTAQLDPLLEAHASARPPAEPRAGAGDTPDSFARSLNLDPAGARGALQALNACSDEQRRAFHELVLARLELDEVARAERVNASEVGRRARAALDAALRAYVEQAAQPC
jgi:DNA-directed RNA polymerase specialized sigma24 family protein